MNDFLKEIGEFDSKKVTVHFDFSKINKHTNRYIEQKESLYLGTFPVMNKIVIHYGDSHQVILKRIHLYNDKVYFEEAEIIKV